MIYNGLNMKKFIVMVILVYFMNLNFYSKANANNINLYDQYSDNFQFDVLIESNGWVIPRKNQKVTITHTANSHIVNVVLINNLNHSKVIKDTKINKFSRIYNLVKNQIAKPGFDFIPKCDDCVLYKISLKINDKSIEFNETRNNISDFINEIERAIGQKL
jgi:hypothetical protein